MTQKISISPRNLVQPYFALSGQRKRERIAGMPGIFRMPSDLIAGDIDILLKKGVRKILLFGLARVKDSRGSDAFDLQGAIQKTVSGLRKRFGKELVIITDVCLCGFTDHGHCGVLRGKKIDLERTLEVLGRVAVSHAQSGVDFVAPSAMARGQVKAVRAALDRSGFRKTGVWAYAIKYASSFYGPFRNALDSAPKFGDRRAYQMDPLDTATALKSAFEDEQNGADVLMVKPALPCLDVIFQLKQRAKVPVAAYHVSGEYGMLKAGSQKKILYEQSAVMESLLAIRRAGADEIVTYYAQQVAGWLK